MRTIRVFPRRTNASPTDDLARFGLPDMWDEADEVRVSVAFDPDIPRAEKFAKEWEYVTSNVSIGGPAYDDPGGEFIPGMYLKRGYTITSRGCPNKCWFCEAWKNEGTIRELTIKPGFNIMDNNILACSKTHIEAVFTMLAEQDKTPLFAGGLEAARLEAWHVERMISLRTKMLWFAYDTPDDLEPLISAAELLRDAGLIPHTHRAGCYVLCGYNSHGRVDSFADAESRLRQAVKLGYFPLAMLYNMGEDWPDYEQKEWKRFARSWAAPQIVGTKIRELTANKREAAR